MGPCSVHRTGRLPGEVAAEDLSSATRQRGGWPPARRQLWAAFYVLSGLSSVVQSACRSDYACGWGAGHLRIQAGPRVGHFGLWATPLGHGAREGAFGRFRRMPVSHKDLGGPGNPPSDRPVEFACPKEYRGLGLLDGPDGDSAQQGPSLPSHSGSGGHHWVSGLRSWCPHTALIHLLRGPVAEGRRFSFQPAEAVDGGSVLFDQGRGQLSVAGWTRCQRRRLWWRLWRRTRRWSSPHTAATR